MTWSLHASRSTRIPTDLRAWHLTPVADGIALVPPTGLADGVIRIRDLQRPLRSAGDIFARANTPVLAAGAIESLITSEGEYAAFQIQRGEIAIYDGMPIAGSTSVDHSVEGVTRSQRVVRYVGAVFGDDAYTLVVGLTSIANAEAFEVVARTCVMRCALGLGHRRHRRYRYTPPSQWTETPWGLASRWRAPNTGGEIVNPSRSAASSKPGEIIVHPAMPATSALSTGLVLEAIYARHGIASMDEVRAPSAPCLARMWRSERLSIAILDDGRFRYPLELVGDAHDVFARVVSSVRLVPPVETPPLTDALLHWVE
jgi:hypothetical protein